MFRLRRRELKMQLHGVPFTMRESAKNPMRQIAALNRKRDITGKFLDGPRQVNAINWLGSSSDIRFITTKVSKEERHILAAKRAHHRTISTVLIPADERPTINS